MVETQVKKSSGTVMSQGRPQSLKLDFIFGNRKYIYLSIIRETSSQMMTMTMQQR